MLCVNARRAGLFRIILNHWYSLTPARYFRSEYASLSYRLSSQFYTALGKKLYSPRILEKCDQGNCSGQREVASTTALVGLLGSGSGDRVYQLVGDLRQMTDVPGSVSAFYRMLIPAAILAPTFSIEEARNQSAGDLSGSSHWEASFLHSTWRCTTLRYLSRR